MPASWGLWHFKLCTASSGPGARRFLLRPITPLTLLGGPLPAGLLLGYAPGAWKAGAFDFPERRDGEKRLKRTS